VGDVSIRICTLGRFRVQRDDEEVAPERFGGRLPRRLIRVLASRLDDVVTRDVLIESLWPRRLPADPDANLNVIVNRARRALSAPDVVETAGGGYRLRGDRCRVDIDEFRCYVAAARKAGSDGDHALVLQAASAALELWGEPLPEDAYEEWSRPVREQLLSAYVTLLEGAAESALDLRRVGEAASLAGRAARQAPLRERAHVLLARALSASGDDAGALTTLRELRLRLVEELDVEPSDEAVELEGELRSSRPSRGATAGDRRDRPPGRRDAFVGRHDELAQLSMLERGTARVVAVEGLPGSGKSRLLDEFAGRTDLPAAAVRAFFPERDTPWALGRRIVEEAVNLDVETLDRMPPTTRQALAELVVPDLDVETPGALAAPMRLDHETRRALAFEGALRAIESMAGTGAVLLVDDVQWADATSLDLLAHSIARAEGLRVVLAHRPLGRRPGVETWMSEIAETTEQVSIRLGRLTTREVIELAGDPDVGQLLAEETDGTPFAIHEAIQHLEHCDVADVRGAARAAARAGQLHAVASRISRQPADARHLLAVVALLGREASTALLAHVSGQPSRSVVDELDLLARTGLVRVGDRGWTTGHDLIAAAVRDRLAPSEEARLHVLIAEALGADGGMPGERAAHLRDAGDERAPVAFARAAREQLSRHAHTEARQIAEAGLAIVEEGPTRSELLAARADARLYHGELRAARDDLSEALTLTSDGERRARLLTMTARLAISTDDLDQAERLVDLALLDAPDASDARARALAVGSIIDMNRGASQRGERRAAEALRLFELRADSAGVADVLDVRAMAVFLEGRIATGVDEFDRVARLFRDSGNLVRVVTPRSTRGHGLVFLDRPAEGLRETDDALELARTLGHLDGQAYALWHRSEALSALNRIDDSLGSAAESLSIAERLGHRSWTATAWRAIGLAHETAGRNDEAIDAQLRSLEAGGSVPLFACWARARLALLSARAGDLDNALELARRAVAEGPALGLYEACYAEAVVAVRRGDADADHLVSSARQRALEGGHVAIARALADI
jgi:DNA-binding SARP family transcriptional activator/tetratricopeptide (TPR) repeat protein